MTSDLELMATIEARIGADGDLARTLIKSPRTTITPGMHASGGGLAALASLRALGAVTGGKLDLHHTLGEGGMGIVHLATQATLGRYVAVKTLRSGHGDVDATLRILREAWVTGALEHPNVVPVYDVAVDDDGAPVIVMKRIEGRPWSELMRDHAEIARRFSSNDPLEWNVRILASVCNAVHFAHSRGILHRDLKPENVMIGEFGEVYVLDWGIAVSVRDDASGRFPLARNATDVAGTPAYMAPEMMLADPASLSERTDVYLLGAIFYEIFSGKPPHSGDNLHAIVSSVLLSNPPYPEGFPAEARSLCERALDREPMRRFESVDAMRVAIEDYLRHRGSRRIAWEARQSLDRLLAAIASEERGEDRPLEVFNLLGECRFGYRAALTAWAENEAARKGLDRALLAVIDFELNEGDPHAASTLLREVSAPPLDVKERVEASVRARAEQDARLKQMEQDLDPAVGTRTRTFLGSIFGVAWTLVPLAAWARIWMGAAPTHWAAIVLSLGFLALGTAAFIWARETLTKTLLNRRLARTLGLQLLLQVLLTSGAWLAGLTPRQSELFLVFSWSATYSLLAAWIEPWFAAPAVVCGLSFLISARFPSLLYPLMSLDNLIFTLVLVRVWFPRADLARILERRQELHRRARSWIRGAPSPNRDGSRSPEL
jgi:serine/threonine-protein kinase